MKVGIMTKYLLFLLLFWLFLSFTYSNQYVIAQENSEDEEEDEVDEIEDPETEEREVSIEVTDSEVKISSESKNEDFKDEFSGTISTSGDAEMKIEYKTEGSETVEAELKVVLSEIVEFLDDNSDGVYDEENDTEIQNYIMSSVGYDPIEYTTNDLGAGGTEHVITIRTTDGVFAFVVHITEQFTTVEGVDLKPTSLKIDLLIENFPYKEDASKLALFHKIESTSSTREVADSPDEDDGTSSGERAITGLGEGIFAFYSWLETAEIDGTSSDVLSSFVEAEETEQKLYLIYEHGSSIVHDPKLGVSIDTSSDSGDTAGATDQISRMFPYISRGALALSTLLSTLLFLAIPVALYYRRR